VLAEPKRLLRIVSGAINFIRFGVFQEEVFNKTKEELVNFTSYFVI